jgi:hypothetical protein
MHKNRNKIEIHVLFTHKIKHQIPTPDIVHHINTLNKTFFFLSTFFLILKFIFVTQPNKLCH